MDEGKPDKNLISRVESEFGRVRKHTWLVLTRISCCSVNVTERERERTNEWFIELGHLPVSNWEQSGK